MSGGMFFDRVAALYDDARPPYPDVLYGRLRELEVLRPGLRVLDIGAGTGQATSVFVAEGADVIAIEPGPDLARLLRARLADVPTLVTTLEAAPLEDGAFDVALSATAFHWVDPARALPKLHRALVPNGLLAVWRNVFGDPEVETPFRAHVAKITAPRSAVEGPRPDPLDVAELMACLTSSGGFTPVASDVFRWQIDLSTDQVRRLFSTFSDWSPDQVDLAAASVDELGGRVTEHYATTLCVCRARS